MRSVKARMNTPDTGDLPLEPVRALSNIEIITLAAYLLGGESRYVDTEDIAVKANDLSNFFNRSTSARLGGALKGL